ncbi:MAG: prepilin-type N-terminal cleavage/methylation domain-containing protein [Gammaproteobacteria bacterium]|nr:prepilin-type N-terminal cleavage/methylation domain-containing protein [Gammaproteobacteria bacterium]
MSFKHLIQHNQKKNRKEYGFTIIEVLIAMFIFSIGVLGVTKMQITAIQTNNIAGNYTQGSSWGISQIESLLAMAYDDANLDHNTTGTMTQGIYTMNWTVTENVPTPNVKQINIVVTWNNQSFTANYYKSISI